jgi:hypothetical protein
VRLIPTKLALRPALAPNLNDVIKLAPTITCDAERAGWQKSKAEKRNALTYFKSMVTALERPARSCSMPF